MVYLIILAILLIPVLSLGYRHFIQFQNVFDQMYYSRVNHGLLSPRDTFRYEQLNERVKIRERNIFSTRYVYEEIHNGKETFFSGYRNENLENGQSIVFRFIRSPYFENEVRGIDFTFRWRFPEEDLYLMLNYHYEIGTRTLTKHPILLNDGSRDGKINDDVVINNFLDRQNIAREDIYELYHFFFFNQILVDWFEANGRYTRFSLDNLGRFTFVNEMAN